LKSGILQPLISDAIFLIASMLTTIYFDNQFLFAANKIDNERFNRFLPDKLKSGKPAISQRKP